VRDLAINLAASLVAGVGVWLFQWLLRYRGLARKRAFFGLSPGSDCLMVVPKHASSPHEHSVHRRDVAAVVELTTIAKDCGARADLVMDEDVPRGIGRFTEFCVGGWMGNRRAIAHLRSILCGVQPEPAQSTERDTAFRIGATVYRADPGQVEYAILARAHGPSSDRPVVSLAGQTAQSNLAAARYLAARYRQLYRTYQSSSNFCLVLKIVESATYGPDFVQVVADVTDRAFKLPMSTAL
jgi:hypothetical protein